MSFWKLMVMTVVLQAFAGVDTVKILLFPYGHCFNSHLYNMEKIADVLTAGGHDVSMLIHANYSRLHARADVSRVKLMQFVPPSGQRIMCSFQTLQGFLDTPLREVIDTYYSSTASYCDALLADRALLARLKAARYDLAIYDVVDPCSQILADYVDVPYITFHSHGLDSLMPRNPAYLPAMVTSYSDDMTFPQRLVNTLGYCIQKVIMYSTRRSLHGLRVKHDINASLAHFNTHERASLKLVLGDYGLDYVGPIQPSTKLVGGFIHPPARPLPDDVLDILEASRDNGVVVLSFGSFVRRYDRHWRELFATTLGELPFTVIWKYEGPTPENLGNNTHLLPWLPQFELLAHPSIRAFVTHSGINSAYESGYHGVPVVAIPLFGEQSFQATKITEHAQMGIKLDIRTLTGRALKNAIFDVAANVQYKQNALRVSKIMRSKPQSQWEELLYWVNYVHIHGGTPHLQSQECNLTWYQLLLLDVIAAYVVAAILLLTSLKCTFLHLCKLLLWTERRLFKSKLA